MRRHLFAVLAALLVGMFVFPTGALGAPKAKTVVCHMEGNGTFMPVEVAPQAVDAHLNHGDGLVGDEVPGMDGYVFGEGCVAESAGPAPGCYEYAGALFDLLYFGPVNTANNIQISNSNDGNCGNPQGDQGWALVIANSPTEFQDECALLGGFPGLTTPLSLQGWLGFPDDAWFCAGTS